MNKTVVAGSSVMGAVALGMIATPAQAAPVTTPCTDDSQHLVSANSFDNWYMDCVPQFGVGKVEFSITSDTDFPAGFVDLTDPAVTRSSDVDDTAADAYFPNRDVSGAFIGLTKDAAASTPTQQFYSGSVVLRVASVESIPTSALPAGCDTPTTPYATAFRLTYLPTDVTFTRTVDGEEVTYRVTSDPAPLILALDPLNSAGPCACPVGRPQSCRKANRSRRPSSTRRSSRGMRDLLCPLYRAVTGPVGSGDRAAWRAGAVDPVPPTPTDPPAPQPTPTPTAPAAAQPELAATGFDATVPGIAGFTLLLGGTAVVLHGGGARVRSDGLISSLGRVDATSPGTRMGTSR